MVVSDAARYHPLRWRNAYKRWWHNGRRRWSVARQRCHCREANPTRREDKRRQWRNNRGNATTSWQTRGQQGKVVRRRWRHNNQLVNKRQMGREVSVDKRQRSVDKTRGGGGAMRGVTTISRRRQ